MRTRQLEQLTVFKLVRIFSYRSHRYDECEVCDVEGKQEISVWKQLSSSGSSGSSSKGSKHKMCTIYHIH
jgi:hypothetical protein